MSHIKKVLLSFGLQFVAWVSALAIASADEWLGLLWIVSVYWVCEVIILALAFLRKMTEIETLVVAGSLMVGAFVVFLLYHVPAWRIRLGLGLSLASVVLTTVTTAVFVIISVIAVARQ